MLIADRKYLFQIVRAQDGNRAAPFISSPAELQELCIKNYNAETDGGYYVLVLADTTLEIKAQDFVSRFPLYTIESWTNLNFNTSEADNHG